MPVILGGFADGRDCCMLCSQGYEEVRVPATKAKPPEVPLIKIEEMEPFAQKAFAGYKTLNRIQSTIYQTGFYSNENMLVRCTSCPSPSARLYQLGLRVDGSAFSQHPRCVLPLALARPTLRW